MSSTPVVSVCIPSYNYARFLEQCLHSVITQDFQDLEIILVDDCSTDNSVDVARRFSDPRLTIHRNPTNLGMVENWNECVRRARGEFVKLLMADDYLMPGSLTRFVKALSASSSAGMASALAVYVDEHSCALRADPWRHKSSYLLLNPENSLMGKAAREVFTRTPTHTILRRSLMKDCGYYSPSFGVSADTHMHVQMMGRAPTLFIGEHLVSFRTHGGAASSGNHSEFARQYRRVMDCLVDQVATSQKRAEIRALARYNAERFVAVQALRAFCRGRVREGMRLAWSVRVRRIIGLNAWRSGVSELSAGPQ